MIYNSEVLDLYEHAKHIGQFEENLTSVITARVGEESAGEIVQIQLQIENDQIRKAKFKAFGSGYTISACEWLCRQLEGQSRQVLNTIDFDSIVSALSLPENKYHVAMRVEDALTELGKA